MSESKKKEIASKGGKASGVSRSAASASRRGAAGHTEAAKRGGANSHHK